MALSDILNKGACGLDTQRGFNTSKGCAIPFKDITELWVTPVGFEFDGTREFNEAYVREVQADGNLTVLKNVQLFENQSTENQFSTSNRGFKELAIEGIYEYKAHFEEDIWFNTVLGSLEGKRNKRVFLVSNGSIFGTEGATEKNYRGFLAYSITRGIQMFTQGTDAAKQYLEIQFASKKEIDDRPVVLSEDVLTFSTDDIEPIVDVGLSFNIQPVDGNSNLIVNAVNTRGSEELSVNGLEFNVTVNDSLLQGIVPSNNESPYQIPLLMTILSAGDVVTVELRGVVDVQGDCLYTSNKITTTVGA